MTDMEEALRAAREAFEPSRADRQRVKHRLRASVAGAGLAASLATKGSTAATSLKWALVPKFFFGGMFVTLVGASLVVAASRGSSSATTATIARPATPAASARLRSSSAATLALPAASVSSEPVPPEPTARTTGSAVLLPTTPSAAPALTSAPSGAELEAELALLREARRASAAGNVLRAREVLDALDLQHSRSFLLEERSALRTVTDCEASGSGAARAQIFLRRYPASVYAAKVRRACGIETKAAAVPSSASFSDPENPGH
jgi:hypothetical protein